MLGVSNMRLAYQAHVGGSQRRSLAQLQSGYKECTQVRVF